MKNWLENSLKIHSKDQLKTNSKNWLKIGLKNQLQKSTPKIDKKFT